MELLQGDCLELMKDIPDGSVDLVLTDPPYGTMKGAQIDSWVKRGDCAEWDETLDTREMFEQVARVLRPNGKSVLFAQEPYTSELVMGAIPSMPFSYRAVWVKNCAGNSLSAKKAMVSRYEDVCVFKKVHDQGGVHPLRAYFKDVLSFSGGKRVVMERIGGKADHVTRVNSTQFSLCTEETYRELVDVFGIDQMPGFRDYADLKRENKRYESTFNLWQGGKSKSNVLEYAKDRGGYHPTQKPVALLEDLIKTFSNAGDTVLDFTMGSGSTGVACVNAGRDFIGIELDEGYYRTACERIAEAERSQQVLENL